jgi:3-deoxy-D-manno-octulosonate 8-phosphate phosphatase (KDO 8-P phosphatase)
VPRKPSRALLKSIRLVVLDVDGTMTDGRLYYGAEGEAMKAFDVRDGHGLRLLQMYAGVKLAVLTGRRADLVMQRCRELSIGHVVGQSRAKGRAIEEIAQAMVVPLEHTCFMGDDVNDLPALRRVGFSCAPADAAPEVLREVTWVAKHRAGRGAVRDLCELLLKATSRWPPPEEEPKGVPGS